jgi:ABC-type transport system involved in cytochrome bd biosynthesis fused ATPase/permease subunit
MGLRTPSSGFIEYKCSNIILDKNLKKNCISFLPQTPFIINTSILQNITFEFTDKASAKTITEANKLLKLVGLDKFANQEGILNFAGEEGANLSGGERQRLALARELYKQFPLLILDEPSSALDKNNKQILIDILMLLIRTLKVGIFIITHDEEIKKIADEHYELNQDGRLVRLT